MLDPKIQSVPQVIISERGSDSETNKQDHYLDFNRTYVKKSKDAIVQSAPAHMKAVDDSIDVIEATEDQISCNRSVKNSIEVSDLLDQTLSQLSQK